MSTFVRLDRILNGAKKKIPSPPSCGGVEILPAFFALFERASRDLQASFRKSLRRPRRLVGWERAPASAEDVTTFYSILPQIIPLWSTVVGSLLGAPTRCRQSTRGLRLSGRPPGRTPSSAVALEAPRRRLRGFLPLAPISASPRVLRSCRLGWSWR